MDNIILICGQKFKSNITHFSFAWPLREIEDMNELNKLKNFHSLTSVSFAGTNLNDFGLQLLSSCKNLDNLNLQDTKITNRGISYLGNLENLKYLRLKENAQLDNFCIPFLNQCHALIDLQIHETGITQQGLDQFAIDSLKNIIVDIYQDNYSHEFLKEYSTKHPQCTILVKGMGEFLNGNFSGEWDY